MTLQDLLERAYDILGDSFANPQEFTRTHLVDLIVEGCREFRRRTDDRWARQDIDLVAGQAVYSQPTSSARLTWIFFDDSSIDPTTIQELQALDERWETRTQTNPEKWTTEAVAHNQFLIYPEPTASTPEAATFVADPNLSGWPAERGALRRLAYSAGGQDAVTADPNVPGWSAERGLIRRRTNTAMSAERGTVRARVETGADNLTVWFVERVASFTSDSTPIPVKAPYQRAPLWYALSLIYTEEGDRNNPALAKYYMTAFETEVDRALLVASKPLAFEVDKLAPAAPREPGPALGWPGEVVVDGVPITVTFPKRGFWS